MADASFLLVMWHCVLALRVCRWRWTGRPGPPWRPCCTARPLSRSATRVSVTSWRRARPPPWVGISMAAAPCIPRPALLRALRAVCSPLRAAAQQLFPWSPSCVQPVGAVPAIPSQLLASASTAAAPVHWSRQGILPSPMSHMLISCWPWLLSLPVPTATGPSGLEAHGGVISDERLLPVTRTIIAGSSKFSAGDVYSHNQQVGPHLMIVGTCTEAHSAGECAAQAQGASVGAPCAPL
jgi:hypothetical protein